MNQNQNSSFSEFKDCSESSDVLKTHPQTSKVSTKGEDSGQEKNDARIILADDDLNVRSALKLLLENEAGLDVVGEAENAQDLIRQAEVCCPEIILLDWELPTLRVEPSPGSHERKTRIPPVGIEVRRRCLHLQRGFARAPAICH